ncbi:MAG: hypothetical protein H7Y04_13375 [Verrucomicrobia bacterium]|nr:hypothetical protein [Cytophagales bacterium]
MKKLFVLCSLLFVTKAIFAQSTAFKQNNIWLEKQLNALGKDKDDNAGFRFRDCEASLEIKDKDSGFNMSMGTSLDGIKTVLYTKEKDGYTLKLLPDKFEKNNNSYSFSLKTDDEKLMQEIKRRLEANIAECKKLKK